MRAKVLAPAGALAVALSLGACALASTGARVVGGTVSAAGSLGYRVGRTAVVGAGGVAVAAGGASLDLASLAVKSSHHSVLALGRGVLDVTPGVTGYVARHPRALLAAMGTVGVPAAALEAVIQAIEAQRVAERFTDVLAQAAAGVEPYRRTVEAVSSSFLADNGVAAEGVRIGLGMGADGQPAIVAVAVEALASEME